MFIYMYVYIYINLCVHYFMWNNNLENLILKRGLIESIIKYFIYATTNQFQGHMSPSTPSSNLNTCSVTSLSKFINSRFY